MGLINAPETFIHMMNSLFIDIMNKGVVIFLKDGLIYSSMAEITSIF